MKKHLAKLLPAAMASSAMGFAGMTLVKIIGGLIVVKLIAVHLGAEGLGRLGLLMAFVALVSTFSGGGITNALIQNLSAANTAKARQRALSAGVKIYVAEAVLAALLLVVCAAPLARILLNDASLAWVFLVLAGTQVIMGAGNLLQAVFSTLQRPRVIVLANTLGTVLGVLVFAMLIARQPFEGAALGIVCLSVGPALAWLAVMPFALPPEWRRLTRDTDRDAMRSLLSYVATILVAVSALPLAQMAVRDLVGTWVGWEYVGYWQGVLRVSDGYMQFVAIMLMYYALPRFSAQQSRAALDKEFSSVRLPMVAAMAAGLGVVYLLRDVVIHLLFTPEFLPARDYFLPQIVNDMLRTLGHFYVYYALSRGARVIPILFELAQAVGLWLFAVYLLPSQQGMTPVYAQMAASGVTLIIMAGLHMGVARRRFFAREAA